MTTKIPDLWPEEIRADVLPPLVILRAQASFVEQKTKGILEAEVTTTEAEQWVYHDLCLIVPAMNRYKIGLLGAWHRSKAIYPVYIIADLAENTPASEMIPSRVQMQMQLPCSPCPEFSRSAHTQEEFITVVRDILQSGKVRAIIQSLLARSQEIDSRRGNKASAASQGTEAASGSTVLEE